MVAYEWFHHDVIRTFLKHENYLNIKKIETNLEHLYKVPL